MLTTVVICTRDRCQQLSRVLETIVHMDAPPKGEWEILIVDNGSSDDTKRVVESFADRLPIRCVSEPVPGLSNARNKAVDEAIGDYICWTDDDVKVGAGWLSGYHEAFLRRPDAVVFGGPIEPEFEGVPPAWLIENRSIMSHLLAERDFGPKEVELSPETLPYGANFAVRRHEMKSHRFNPALGVGPGVNRLGEETEVLAAMLKEGKGFWVPTAGVRHVIPQARQTLAYVERYNRAGGETWAYQNFIRDNQKKKFPFWALKGAIIKTIFLQLGRLRGKQVSPQVVSELGYAKGVLGFYFRVVP